MPKSKNQTMTLEQWSSHFSGSLAVETAKLFEFRHKSSKVSQALLHDYVARFVEISVLDCLNYRPAKEMTKKQEYEYVKKNFTAIKVVLQDAVGQGFQNAVSSFVGYPVDYFCRINEVPKPVNEVPC